MARTSIRNISGGAMPLPSPYGGMLPAGKSAVVIDTPEQILANLGGPDFVPNVVDLETLPEGSELTAHSFISSNAINVTLEALTIQIDPAAGHDEVRPFTYRAQAQVAAHGPWATVANAVECLPSRIRHAVVLQFPIGLLAFPTLGQFDRFTFEGGYIELDSAADLKRVTGTSTYEVASGTDTQVTLAADPGFALNDKTGVWMRVVSGTGVGQYKAVMANNAAVFEVVGRFLPVLDGTSVVEFVVPSTVITVAGVAGMHASRDASLINVMAGHTDLRLRRIDLATMLILGTNLEITGGARVLGLVQIQESGYLQMDNCIIDGLGTMPMALLVGGGRVRTANSDSSWLLRRATGPVLFIGGYGNIDAGGNAYLFKGGIQEGVDGVYVKSPTACAELLHIIRSRNLTGIGVRLEHRAYMKVEQSILGDSRYITGGTSAIQLDGANSAWTDLDADPNDTLESYRHSIITAKA